MQCRRLSTFYCWRHQGERLLSVFVYHLSHRQGTVLKATNSEVGTGPVLVVAVRVLSLDSPSVVAPAFTAFDRSASYAASALSSFFGSS